MSLATTKFGQNTVSNYNTAISGVSTPHTIKQAKYIIRRMKKDTKIDFNTDWKMITVLIGHNDICLDVCKKNHTEADTAIGNVQQMLDILHHALTRTFVNLMPIGGKLFVFNI